MKLPTVLVTAYSKAPQNTTMYEHNKYIGVMLEINRENHIVIDAQCTFLTTIAQSYFRKMVIGACFRGNLEELYKTIEDNFIAPSSHSLVVALKIAHQRYHDAIMNTKGE